ncbi:helix-turn-helix transcriptional regulator [Lolliginicoccus levis]|uniref:helix-turn-helix transcriptional regulator n=1 Tax=Lolliginicoccus levis TaxID=2919542 RepID=UPI00241F56A3|nr:metalloregulator ArsR/SmtB family transcription factor [Lolliginicoccus levis]
MGALPGQGRGAGSATSAVVSSGGFAHESRTRAEVVRLLLEQGPIAASAIGATLGLSAAGVRRHLDVLLENGDAEVAATTRYQQRGRGRPAKQYMLSAAGRERLSHAYDDLATAAMRELRAVGGNEVIEQFADRRVRSIIGSISNRDGAGAVEDTAGRIAEALTAAGYAASTRRVGSGVQICQHHCPVSHVAAEFPELCEAEQAVFAEVLGTHVQRLATIANGDCACTTHVPLPARASDRSEPAGIEEELVHQTQSSPAAQPAAGPQRLREEHA